MALNEDEFSNILTHDKTMLQSLIKSMSLVILMRVGGIALQLLWFVLLVRLLPLEAVGIYSVVNSLWILTRALGPAGYEIAFLREGGAKVAQHRYSDAKSYLHFGIGKALIFNSMLYAAVGLAAYWWQDSLRFISLSSVYIALIGSYAYLLFGFYSSAMLALEKQISAHALESLLLPFSVMVSAVLMAFSEMLTIDNLIIAQTIIALFIAAIYWMITRHNYGHHREKFTFDAKQEYKQLAKRLFGTIAFNNLNVRLPVVIAPFLIGIAATALLEAAIRFASLLGVIQWCASFVVLPKISKVDTTAEPETLQNLLIIGCWIVFLPSLALFLTLVFGGELLLEYIAGEEYIAAYLPMIILAIGYLINSSSGPTTHFYMLLGYEKTALKISTTETVIALITITVFSHYYGIIGMVTGMSLGLFFRNACLNYKLKDLTTLYSAIWSITGWKHAYQIGVHRAE